MSTRTRNLIIGGFVLVLISSLALLFSSRAEAQGVCRIEGFEGKIAVADCPDEANTAVYKLAEPPASPFVFENAVPQTWFSTDTLPECGGWQADVFTGEVIKPTVDLEHRYSDRLLAHLEGDQGACVDATTTSTSTSTSTTTTAPAEILPVTTARPKPQQLARTGASENRWFLRGLGLVLLGFGLVKAAEGRLITARVQARRNY